MLRIRFHGRGGQGMKTASRIVGTAAFRQGFFAQDSPVYGAERRGAPMVAFTRFDSRPILERGFVSSPGLLIIADESLVNDPQVKALDGVSPDTTILINSPKRNDFTGLVLRFTGSTSALGVALGAAAAKLAGLEKSFVEEAVRKETAALGLQAELLEKNFQLARAAFDMAVPEHPVVANEAGSKEQTWIVTPTYRGASLGTASISSLPNTPLRKTGDWRVIRPVIDLKRCTHCWICFVNCPDGGIALRQGDIPEIDYGVCKGCLICAEECPIHAIQTVREATCVRGS